MPEIIFLGTASAVPDERHENTHMVIVGRQRMILVDCVNNPNLRLRQAGLDDLKLTDVILTHFHPDHVSGLPSLLMNSWLKGRRESLNIYGLAYTLDRIEKLMDFYDWKSWPNFFPVNFYRLPEERMALVIENQELRVQSIKVCHMVPTIGLRVEFLETGKVFAYSCDTEPCSQVVQLARGANVLVHEASGDTLGHSSAAQAGEIARQAGVEQLYLIHYPSNGCDPNQLVNDARVTFLGQVFLSEDLMSLNF
jgi:ribonuclease Z